MTRYIFNNEDGYIFSSITASFNCPVSYSALPTDDRIGVLEMEFGNMKSIINDGQHRAAAIAVAMKEESRNREREISVFV